MSEKVVPEKTRETAAFKHDRPLTTLAVDPTGRFAAVGAQDLDIQLFDIASEEKRTLAGHKSWVRSLDFSADGERLYSACWGGEVKIWDTAFASEAKPLRSIQAHEGAARFVRVNPSGDKLATCGNDLLVKVWRIVDGSCLHEFAGHERHVYGVDFHPGGKHIVSQDLMGRVFVWNVETGKKEHAIDAKVMTGYDKKFAADMGGSRDLAFHPKGTQWASSGITNVVNSFAGIQDPIVVVFDWKSAKITQQIKSADKNLKGIAWGVQYHPQGFLIAAIADRSGKGELWFAKPSEEKPFHVHKFKSAARGMGIFPDGERLAIAHADGVMRVYEMNEAGKKKDST